MTDYVYFQQHIDPGHDWIRIGRTDGNGKREDAQNNYEPIAMIQGGYDDETALHTHFKRLGRLVKQKRDISTYEGTEIYEYVIWLLDRNLAGRDRAEAEAMPRLPWTVWGPHAQRHEGRDGELSLFTILPRRERLRMARSDLAHLSSESDDWYTPPHLIDGARQAMGSIDLDPASCDVAQRQIQATTWYSKELDGLRTDLPWEGNVWLNPPYGRGESSAVAFVQRLLRELEAGNVTQAVTCLNLGSISALWFEPMWRHAAIHLIHRGRPNFWNDQHQASSPTKGTILSYFGTDTAQFATAFARYGHLITTAG